MALISAARIADYDPDLFSALGADRGQAERVAMASCLQLEPGPIDFLHPDPGLESLESLAEDHNSLGLLVLEGLLWREVTLGSGTGVELLGPGDLLRPWVLLSGSEFVAEGRWSVLQPSLVALLDHRFTVVLARWPPLITTLMDRLILRSRWTALHLAISHVPNLRQRLLLVLWHFAQRWGKVTPDGVVVPLEIPHRMLAQMVGARRPSVTTALGELRSKGDLLERAEGGWILTGDRPPR